MRRTLCGGWQRGVRTKKSRVAQREAQSEAQGWRRGWRRGGAGVAQGLRRGCAPLAHEVAQVWRRCDQQPAAKQPTAIKTATTTTRANTRTNAQTGGSATKHTDRHADREGGGGARSPARPPPVSCVLPSAGDLPSPACHRDGTDHPPRFAPRPYPSSNRTGRPQDVELRLWH